MAVDLSWLPAAISSTASLFNAGFSGRMSKKQMQLQNQYNRENWLMQAMYNSPASQAARFAKAGFNRNLAIGDGGNMSQPLNQQAPDYSNQFSQANEAINSLGSSLSRMFYDKRQRELDRVIKRDQMQLEKERIDNARQQLAINRMLANMNITKGNLVAASLSLDNNFKSRTLLPRIQNQYNVAGISGNRYQITSAEAAAAPEFYQIRNDELASRMAYRKAQTALGYSRLLENRRQFNLGFGLNERRYELDSRKFAHNKALDWEQYQLAARRVIALEQQLQVAQDAEERKYIEQQLNYAYKAMDAILKFTVPVPKSPTTIYKR